MIPRELLKGDLHLLDLPGVGFEGADSFTTVTSSSTSVKGNVSQSLLGFCQRRFTYDIIAVRTFTYGIHWHGTLAGGWRRIG